MQQAFDGLSSEIRSQPPFNHVAKSLEHSDFSICENIVARTMDNDQLSQSDPPTVEDLSSFRNGHDERDTDVFIAVMGVTGAGKSSLISKLATGDVKPKIGNNLRSCE